MTYNDRTAGVCYYCVNNNNYLDFKITFDADVRVNIGQIYHWSRQPAQGMYASWNEVRPATKELS